MGLHYLSTNANYGALWSIGMGLKRGIRAQNPDGSSMQVSIHAFHRVTIIHNNVHHDGSWYLRHRYPLQFGGDMDNIPSLQIGFDGHYVVCLWETGGEIPPVHPAIEWERPPRFRSIFNFNTHYKPLTTKRSFDIEPLREPFFRTHMNLPDLVHQGAVHFLIFDSKVSHGNRRARMIEPLTDDLEPNTIFCPLHVPPGLS